MLCFFLNDTATTEIYTYGHTLSLHYALPIYWLSCCWVSSGNMRRKNGSLPNGLTRTTCRVRTLTTAGVTFSSIGASEGSGWPATVVGRAEMAGTAAGKIGRHTSELQSLMRISYAVFCLKKKNRYTALTL